MDRTCLGNVSVVSADGAGGGIHRTGPLVNLDTVTSPAKPTPVPLDRYPMPWRPLSGCPIFAASLFSCCSDPMLLRLVISVKRFPSVAVCSVDGRVQFSLQPAHRLLDSVDDFLPSFSEGLVLWVVRRPGEPVWMVAPVSVEDLRVCQALVLQGEKIGGSSGVLPKTDTSGPERLLALRAKLLGQCVRVGAKVGASRDVPASQRSAGERKTAMATQMMSIGQTKEGIDRARSCRCQARRGHTGCSARRK